MDRALVIGGGIVGLSCAIELLGRGMPVTVVSAAHMRGTASWGNAGHIAIEQVAPLASIATIRDAPRRLFSRGGPLSLPLGEIPTWLPFSVRLLAAARPAIFKKGQAALESALAEAVPAWRRLLAKANASDLLLERGHYILWEHERGTHQGLSTLSHAAIGTAKVREITFDEQTRLQSLVKQRLSAGARFTGSGQIADQDALADALEATFMRLGGTRITTTARGLRRRPDGNADVLLQSGEAIPARVVIVAAGAASGVLLRSLRHRVPIIAERGYHIQAPADWPADMPPVVFEDRSMIVTRFRERLRAASFVEFARIATPSDPRKWARLEAHCAALGIRFTGPIERWMGARPTLPDYLPAIGRSAAASNLFYAFGHQHLGLTLGPVTGEAIGALVTGDGSSFDLAPFDLERFGRR
jgi:D-amino-acid dehydrogenase